MRDALAGLSDRALLVRVLQEVRAVRLHQTGPWRFAFLLIRGFGDLEEDLRMLTLTTVQKVVLRVRPVDVKDNPAPVDGPPEWTASNPALVSLLVDPDGLGAVLLATGPVGSCQVKVSADADLGEGFTSIEGLLDVEIKPAEAVSLKVEAGTPENQ
jgi:hypothetical protein